MLERLPAAITRISSLLLIVCLTVLSLMPAAYVQAASLTALSDTMSSQTINATSSHAIRFTTPTGASDNTDTIVVTFPATFNFTSKTIGTVSFSHGATLGTESVETLAASPSPTAWGAVFSGTQNRILTLTAPTDGVGTTTLAAGEKIIISYDSSNSINPSSASSYAITIDGTFGDTGSVTVNILTTNQVNISGVVPQSLTFSLGTTTISFGTLNAAAARFASSSTGSASETEGHNVIIGTNAANGYTMSINGTTLLSGSNSIDAIGSSNTASSVGTEQFGVRMVAYRW